jgi:hypothetical protein
MDDVGRLALPWTSVGRFSVWAGRCDTEFLNMTLIDIRDVGSGRGGDGDRRTWRHHRLRQSPPTHGVSRSGSVRALQRRHTLCRRYRKLARAGKLPTVVTTAIARELAGFAWAIAKHVQAAAA